MRIDASAQTSIAATAPVQVAAPAPAPTTPTPIPVTAPAMVPATAPATTDTYNPEADMHNAIENINRYLRNTDRNVQFDVDQSTGETVVKVVDAFTQEVIRQMPSDESLAIARAISKFSGLFLNEKA